MTNPNHIKQLREATRSLQTQVSHLIRDEDTAQVLCDLLSTVRYILKLQLPSAPVSKKSVRRYDPSDDDENELLLEVSDPSEDLDGRAIDPSLAYLDASEARERSKRSLREEWAGSLPKVPTKPPKRRPRVGVDVDRNGISGPDPDSYDTAQGSLSAICRNCGSPIGSHPADRNSPVDADGNRPRIACDGTRVYCGRVEE